MASVAPVGSTQASATPAATPTPAASNAADDTVTLSSLEQRTLNPEWFLYTELARFYLGERAALIIDLLISKGRLSVFEILERSPSLDARSIRTALVSLIQVRCVRYWEEVAPSGRSTTYYYFNEDGLLLFLYSGLIIEEVSQQVPQSDLAAQIAQSILSLGSITVKDFLHNFESSKNEILSVFVQLCESGFLSPLSKLHYAPLNDLWTHLYEKEYDAIPRTSTLSDLKKRTEAKGKAKVEFQKLLSAANDTSSILTVDPETSLRTVVNTAPLVLNLERFLKSRRSKQLVKLAKTRTGSVPAEIYKVALAISERKTPPLVDPMKRTGLLQELDEAKAIEEDLELMEEKTQGVTFNAIDISKYLPSTFDLRGTMVSTLKGTRNSNDTGGQPNKRLKTEDGFVIPPLPKNINNEVDQNEDEDFEDFDDNDPDPHSISLINNHLRLLASSSIPFLKESRPGVYYVPYSKLVPALKSSVYDYLLASTLGPSAMRIRRCICANSLVSEKVINSTALMKEKDIRSTIASLVKYNVVEIQEVPRTADRAASRAVFLFRSKERHAYDFMKQNLAWNIGNLLFKKEKLKEENIDLLTKANRDDVKGRESELLLPSELNQLRMVNERELNIITRVCRVLSLWEVFKFF
ncbi:hypothetical protein HG536_0F00280 [Torulaspora globosa]|uniref:DNA-directed RNA polymerase III subunit RPC3 n=1 Tax=Torulaspora globosa TaxID=48254 RepID=A0A7G3ZJL8_9SACH|nr:uncharacterized protein HG536_0F00280 [Torulaspora globosa]QLL33704.1 hypothetical protein HG536_0F00280 [Torulaspora globosa]